MKFLMQDEDRYNEGYKILLERLERRRWSEEWANNVFPGAIVQKLASKPNQSQGADDGAICSLGIGTGNGEYELHLLKQLSSRFPRIKHVVIEPSHDFIQEYQTEAANVPFTGSIEFEWYEGTFQGYKEKTLDSADGRFDFISAIHSLYYADNARETVKLLYDCLAPGGMMMIDMTDDVSCGQGMWTDFPELQQMFTSKKWISNSDVTAALQDMNIPFSRLVNPIFFDITDVFDETSWEGGLLLDFFTQVSNFRQTDSDLVKRVLQFLRMKSKEHMATVEGADSGDSDRLKLKRVWETLIIEKPSKN
ncbi:histamine N-methyltransferase-like [Lytechinus variegatus]|uniref:histamine N-methyltransferase-like n=1 Tax=Lytechinus variegatus TaxID=7654 RepID=UPI001BB2A92C|nr:histamine N-methyltransferase-like [Lytechinus variegatus]XP_041475909.1 histamine N-methyltransferase-like [Lytechinus variegatus]XP_041475919.1 histamine N-methyltransferase-like [Lytechinus variegatus]